MNLPAPTAVADLCLEAAWLDDIDDDVRLRLEYAHDTIRQLLDRTVMLARTLEQLEAER